MEGCAYDYRNHWDPCDLEAVQKSRHQVYISHYEQAWQQDKYVGVCNFNYSLILPEDPENGLRKKERNSEWNCNNCHDNPASIQINAA